MNGEDVYTWTMDMVCVCGSLRLPHAVTQQSRKKKEKRTRSRREMGIPQMRKEETGIRDQNGMRKVKSEKKKLERAGIAYSLLTDQRAR